MKQLSFTVTHSRGQFASGRPLKCSLCGNPIPLGPGGWRYGNNPWPLSGGRCCDACNETAVIAARLARLRANSPDPETVDRCGNPIPAWLSEARARSAKYAATRRERRVAASDARRSARRARHSLALRVR
jgi:hypothetical protein